jgi:hypothetical protein
MNTPPLTEGQRPKPLVQLPSLTALLGSVILMCGATPVMAQGGPSIGNVEGFALLAGSTVTVAATGTVISGHVGVSPGTSITGIPAGGTLTGDSATHSNTRLAIAAQASSNALYVELASTGPCKAITAELGGTTVVPGNYAFSSSANIAAGTTLTLNGEGIYIFKVGSAITANVGSSVVLQNGASASQVFWQVTSAATLNGVTFSGTVVAQAAITLGVDAILCGRALATTAGAVTLAGNNTVVCNLAPPAATATFTNGGGTNEACMSSTPCVVGEDWCSTVTHSSHPGAMLTVVVGFFGASTGIMTPSGELLVDFSSAMVYLSVLPATGMEDVHCYSIPADAALVGMAFSAQGAIVVAGPGVPAPVLCVFCNGYDHEVGH